MTKPKVGFTGSAVKAGAAAYVELVVEDAGVAGVKAVFKAHIQTLI